MKTPSISYATGSNKVINMSGGIDENMPSVQMSPGTLIECANYMITEGDSGGYTSVKGYERLDGEFLPSRESTFIITINTSDSIDTIPLVQVNTGDIILGSISSVEAIADGVIDGDEQTVEVSVIDDTFVQREELNILGTPIGYNFGVKSSTGTERHHALLDATRASVRPVGTTGSPCEGPVLGLTIYNESIYAFRKKTGLLEIGMFKDDSTDGWIEIDTSDDPIVYSSVDAHTFSFDTYNFYGGTSTDSLYWVDTYNQARSYDGSVVSTINNCGMTKLDNPYSADNLDNDVCYQLDKLEYGWDNLLEVEVSTPASIEEGDWIELTVAHAGLKTFFDTYGNRLLLKRSDRAGDMIPVFVSTNGADETIIMCQASEDDADTRDFILRIYYDQDQLENTTTATPPTKDHTATANTLIERDFSVTSINDAPTKIVARSNRLFLSYIGGSLQYSELGNPMGWSGVNGAGELGMGDEVTNLSLGVGGSLLIFMLSSIYIIDGETPATWVLKQFSNSSGAFSGTAKRLLGTTFFMDDRGITTLEAVQEYGDYAANSISTKFKKTLMLNKEAITTSVVSRELNQYRLFFSTGLGILTSFKAKELQGTTFVEYPISVDKVAEGSLFNRASIIFSSDVSVVGGENVEGYVYLMDSGTSFDTVEIITKMVTSYYHYSSPRLWKRFISAIIDAQIPVDLILNLKVNFDYSAPTLPTTAWITRTSGLVAVEASAYGSAIYGEGTYGQVPVTTSFPIYLAGYGTNCSFKILTNSRYVKQHTIQNIIVDYSTLSRRV